MLRDRYRAALDRLDPALVRGPIRQRLVDGAQRRYEVGLRRSLIAMRSKRYFRLLDALEELVAEAPAAPTDQKPDDTTSITIDAAYKGVRKAAKAARAEEDDPDEALHRIRKRAKRLRYTASATGADDVSQQAKAIKRCSASIKTAWSAASIWCTRPMPRTPPARTPSPTACSTSRRPTWPMPRISRWTRRCTSSTRRFRKPAAEGGG